MAGRSDDSARTDRPWIGGGSLPAMTRLASSCRAGYVALAVIDSALAGSARPRAHRTRRVTKPLLLPVLAAGFAADPRAARSPLRTSTQVAQVCGWAGDIALLRTGLVPFAAGMGAFGAGHAAYITGMRKHVGDRPLWKGRPAQLAAAVWALLGPALARGAARQERVLGPAVLAYAALLSATAAYAGNLGADLPADARRASLAGALAFLLSDGLLATGQFLLDDPPPLLESAVMASYTLAQGLLAEGALRAAG